MKDGHRNVRCVVVLSFDAGRKKCQRFFMTWFLGMGRYSDNGDMEIIVLSSYDNILLIVIMEIYGNDTENVYRYV